MSKFRISDKIKMASFNKVILIGNLVADPELKQTPSSVSVTSFDIGVSRRFGDASGQRVSDFFHIVAWRSTAEFITKYFAKGDSILVCGQLQQRSWTDQNGQKKYVVEVVAEEATFVNSKAAASSQNTAQTPTPTPATQTPQTASYTPAQAHQTDTEKPSNPVYSDVGFANSMAQAVRQAPTTMQELPDEDNLPF